MSAGTSMIDVGRAHAILCRHCEEARIAWTVAEGTHWIRCPRCLRETCVTVRWTGEEWRLRASQ